MPALPWHPLLHFPTPLHPLPVLSQQLGIDLWIKRDDLNGFALGGNKARKLEYLAPAILESGASHVVTCGSLQSNFIRQMGVLGIMSGFHVTAAVMEMPFDAAAGHPGCSVGEKGGNVLIDQMSGVDLVLQPDGTWEELADAAANEAERLRRQGHKVYEIPVGGSTPQGVYGFLKAGEEIENQTDLPFDAIVTASSSGSTQTGLAQWFAGSSTRIVGIGCDPEPELPHDLADLSAQLCELLQWGTPLLASDLEFHLDWVGPGYNVPSQEGEDAAYRLMETEGIFVDPIYSGKAFAGLLGLAESGRLRGRVCFWHTGGIPTLFAHV